MTLPDDWADPVRLALREAFGVDAPQSMALLSGGLSGAPVLRITVADRPYVLRLDPPVEGFADPRRWHQCMRIAAEAGVAPPVRYVGASGVSIVDFLEPDPPPGAAEDPAPRLGLIGAMLRRLHAAPAFPSLVDYMEGMDAVTAQTRSLGWFSEADLAIPLARYAQVARAYRALAPLPVSGHNDVNPRNLVFSGGRPWLVDWTAAFLSDPYVDLASIASFLARDPASEAVLLAAYFGAPASPAQSARMYLARLVNHMFYAMTMTAASGGAPPLRNRDLDVLHQALRAGEAVLDSAPGRAEYARARLAALVAGVEAPRFAEACRVAI
jgi:aminoglycoside phosphotransferase (APT) family kinase protein